jgi:putative hemolysin
MKKRKAIWKLIVGLIIIVILAFSFYSLNKPKQQENISQIANPASKYCIDNGGNLSIRNDETGGQYGVCTFKDGSECEEWKFFRGECNTAIKDKNKSSDECEQDNDCIPASCCHPTSCINKNFSTNCIGIMCTMDCKIGTLDCGYGSCKCINKKCSAIINQ